MKVLTLLSDPVLIFNTQHETLTAVKSIRKLSEF